MSIDTKLYESLNNNSNLSVSQKELLYAYLIQIKRSIFDPYISDFNFDNILMLLQNLKVVEGSENEIIYYDKQSNTLVLGKSPKDQEFNTYRSLQIGRAHV